MNELIIKRDNEEIQIVEIVDLSSREPNAGYVTSLRSGS
jgi:hypothetical protein